MIRRIYRADTHDLIAEIYKVTPFGLHYKIDEMFKQIITYSSKVESVSSKKVSDKKQSNKRKNNRIG